MKQLLLVISFIIILNMKVFGQTIFRQVGNFAEIPTELLSHIDKMGVDSSLILNEYEGKYLNFIFKVNPQDFNLTGKKVSYKSKIGFFKDEKEWFYRREQSGVGGTALYIFNVDQKEESGGYDVAIVYWSKFVIPIEKVIKRLKKSN
ncbi:MAG: hypothetical protein LBC68_09850 [Prevotellaceae bacterium]|jgi:hypothetical protein|nr:hypothetical protein [Prevotellaceae bacterium]